MPTYAFRRVLYIIGLPTRLAYKLIENRKHCVHIISRDIASDALLDSLDVLKSLPMAHAPPA